MGTDILSEEAKKKLYRPFLNDYAYGWDYLETDRGTLLQHDGGSRFGANAEFRRYIDANVVTIVLCNRLYLGEMLFAAVRGSLERLAFGDNVAPPPDLELVPEIDMSSLVGSYRTEKGNLIRVESLEGDGLILLGEGQEVISLLCLPDEQAGDAEKLSQSAKQLLESLGTRDWAAIGGLLENEDRLERFRAAITRRVGGEVGLGELRVLGTGSTWWNQPSELATHISKASDPFRTVFRFHWDGGRIAALGGSAIPHPAPTPLVPRGDGELVGYHLGIGKAIFVTFESGKLVLSDGRASLEASKE
jgi:hypothetical protein